MLEISFEPSFLMTRCTCANEGTASNVATRTANGRIAQMLPQRQNAPMSLAPIQEDVEKWIASHTDGYFPPLLMLARLTEELGELSRAVSHEFTIKKPKPGEKPGN